MTSAGKCTKACPNHPHWNRSTFDKKITILSPSFFPFSPNFVYWEWCRLVWNIPLVILVKPEVWGHFRCKVTANYAWRKLYSAFMHFTSKTFSTQQTTPIFTNLLDIQKHMCFPTYNLFIHSIIWYLVVVPKSILLWLHENFLPHWFPIVLQWHFSSRWRSQ